MVTWSGDLGSVLRPEITTQDACPAWDSTAIQEKQLGQTHFCGGLATVTGCAWTSWLLGYVGLGASLSHRRPCLPSDYNR